jgi:hypothetical protein
MESHLTEFWGPGISHFGKFIVSNAGEAYDAQAKRLHRKFRPIPATAPELPAGNIM